MDSACGMKPFWRGYDNNDDDDMFLTDEDDAKEAAAWTSGSKVNSQR
jgi:hypothetical protein